MHTRRQILKYGAGAAATLALADPAVRVAYNLAGARRVLPPELEKPLIPSVLAIAGSNSGGSDEYIPITEAMGPLPDSTKVEYVADQWAGCQFVQLLKNPLYPSAGEAYFAGEFDVETGRLYGIVPWPSEKREVNDSAINVFLDTKNTADKKTQKHDFGLIVGINKQGKKFSKFGYGGLSTQDGWPKNWVISPATINWSCGLTNTPYSQDEHMLFKFDFPLTLANPEKISIEGMEVEVGNGTRGDWSTFPQQTDYSKPSTWGKTSLPTDFPYVGEKIDISPALIIPDSSRPEYVDPNELERTILGKQKEKEGWKFEHEWGDTESEGVSREVRLLDNVYNKTPNTGDARARMKCDFEKQMLHGIVLRPSEKTEKPNEFMLFLVDTKCENDYYPQSHHLIFNMWYDAAEKKKTAYSQGTGRGWPRVLGQTPSDIVSSSGLAVTPLSEDENDKCLIYKFSIPLSRINPNNLARERMAVVVGEADSDCYLSYPKNESWTTGYTWADAFYLGEELAVPDIPPFALPATEVVALGITSWLLKRASPERFAQFSEAYREVLKLRSALFGHQ